MTELITRKQAKRICDLCDTISVAETRINWLNKKPDDYFAGMPVTRDSMLNKYRDIAAKARIELYQAGGKEE